MAPEPKCPFCDRLITTWTVIKAPVPWAIRCQACRQKISVCNARRYLGAYLLAVAAIAVALIIAHRRNVISIGAVIVIALIFMVALEFVTSTIVLRRGKFVKPGT